jgi:hypothetical protein
MHKLSLLPVIVAVVISMTACGGGEDAPATAPLPGGVLTGPIEISGKASGGTIDLTVAQDGASIISVKITLTDLNCDGFSAGSLTQEGGGVFPVAKGKVVASPSGIGEVKGQFTSPTVASGTIDLVLEIPYDGTCELGTWNWSAKTEVGTGQGSSPTVTPASPLTAPTEELR